MNYKVLYRKYRPDIFDNIVGQEFIVNNLKKAILNDKISHAYLFTGPRGTGKTSTAKVFAKAINCLNLKNGNPCCECDACKYFNESSDIIEIDAASNTGVDNIREIINNANLAASYSKYKVYIIDEVHMLSTSAFNALLLTLEEPPGNVVFILATTEVQKVPITILSRCQRYDFKPIKKDVLINQIKTIATKEKINIDDGAIDEIASISNGGMRDALSIFDQLSNISKKITEKDILDNFSAVSTIKIKDLIKSFADNDIEKVNEIIDKFSIDGVDYKITIQKLIDELNQCAFNIKLNKSDYNVRFDTLYSLIIDLNNCLNNTNININPYILIKLSILKYMNVDDDYNPGNNEISNYNPENNNEKIISQEIKNINETFTKIDDNKEDNVKKTEINKTINSDSNNKVTKVISIDTLIDVDEEFISTRINNTFVEINKNSKMVLMKNWKEFIDNIKDKSLYSILIDTNVEMASNSYAILSNKSSSSSKLFNSRLNEIETLYESMFNVKYKLICVSKDELKIIIEEYMKNKNKKYEYIEEKIMKISQSSNSEIESMALNLFEQSSIEIE